MQRKVLALYDSVRRKLHYEEFAHCDSIRSRCGQKIMDACYCGQSIVEGLSKLVQICATSTRPSRNPAYRRKHIVDSMLKLMSHDFLVSCAVCQILMEFHTINGSGKKIG